MQRPLRPPLPAIACCCSCFLFVLVCFGLFALVFPHNTRTSQIAVDTTTYFTAAAAVTWHVCSSGFWRTESHENMQHLSGCPEECEEGLDGSKGIFRGILCMGERVHWAERGSLVGTFTLVLRSVRRGSLAGRSYGWGGGGKEAHRQRPPLHVITLHVAVAVMLVVPSPTTPTLPNACYIELWRARNILPTKWAHGRNERTSCGSVCYCSKFCTFLSVRLVRSPS